MLIKRSFLIKISLVNVNILQKIADWFTFTREIINRKIHFCSVDDESGFDGNNFNEKFILLSTGKNMQNNEIRDCGQISPLILSNLQ